MWKGWRSVVGEVRCVMGGVEVCKWGGVEVCGWGGVDVGGGSMSVLL